MVELVVKNKFLESTVNQKSGYSEDIDQFITSSQETFLFMRLSPEIRNMIYKEALVIPKPRIIRLRFDEGSPR